MPLETGVTGIEDLNSAWPTGTDPKSQGDDHIRNVKAAVQGSWPNMNGPNTLTALLTAQGFNAGNQVVADVADPSDAQHAATKAYVDGRTTNLDLGYIDGNNGNILLYRGDGLQVTKEGVGVYKLDFTVVYSNEIVLAQIYSTGVNLLSANWSRIADGSGRVRTVAYYNSTIGDAAIDSAFMFVRFGW